MFRTAVEIRSDEDGVDIKLPMAIKVDPSTGQMTTVIDDAPQLPFSSFALHFKDGPRAAVTTPSACGTYTTNATFDSWSGKAVSTSSSFNVSGNCAPRGFSPSFKAGTVNPVAGAFSPFTLDLARSDADQELSSISPLTLPAGLLANIGSVPKCSDAQAAAAACPDASRLGNVTVGSGAGPNPFYVTDGNAYLTGPYKGAPFGMAFVVHAKAGPFDLGTVVTRAALRIDPTTSQAIIESDPFPSILAGVPLRIRDVRVTIDRPHFMFNPTSCQEQQVAATVTSTQGTKVPVSQRFQVGECAALSFHPKFTASTQAGGTFNRGGASLDVKISSNQGAESHEANIRKVEVQLPKMLPSRLTTLQKACTEGQFAANPAGCPAASDVGTATVHTPTLAGPLSGPAYLVSHGGRAFPDLVLVLKGEGITLQVTGHTQIRNGVTYSRFETVPDAPITSFELKLPEGPYSALAAVGNVCGTTKTTKTNRTVRRHGRKVRIVRSKHVAAPLAMPTTITAQNGTVITQNTKVVPTGCRAVAKKAAKARRAMAIPRAAKVAPGAAGRIR